MRKLLLLGMFISSLLVLVLPVGLAIPVSAAAQGSLSRQNTLPNTLDLDASLSGLRSGLDTSDFIASRAAKGASVITFFTPQVIGVGDYFILSGYIRDLSGHPVANVAIHFVLNGEVLGQASSNPSGFFERKFKAKDFDAGTYTVAAFFNGSHLFNKSVASTHLTIYPAVLHVQTVPPIPGIAFQMDGKQYVAGEDGSLIIPVDIPGTHRLTILMDKYNNPSQRIEFSRWMDGSFQTYQDIVVPTSKIVYAGFNVFHQVGLAFVDLKKIPVDPQRITAISIRSAQGDVITFTDGQPRWIPASRISRLGGALVPTPLLYSVISVMADGSNVVNSSQQQFYALPDDTWQISMLLYSIRFTAADGLFGFPAGKSINLVFPNGTVRNFPLDQAGVAEIHSLARGNYTIELVGVHGLGSRTPVALSRSQTVAVKEISYLDLAVVGGIGTLLVLGLLLYGRPKMFSPLFRRNRSQTPAVGNALMEVNANLRMDELIKWF